MDMIVAMMMIAACLMLVVKLGLEALKTLKARYDAVASLNLMSLLEEDKEIDMIRSPEEQAIKRLIYKSKRDKALDRASVIVANHEARE